MNKLKKVVAAVLSTATIASVAIGGSNVTAGASGTGAGLAEHALNAYYEGWDYVWGGTSVGAVDCSGLIWMYCGGDRMSMLSDAQANGRDWGYVDNGIPRVHGLGLSRPGRRKRQRLRRMLSANRRERLEQLGLLVQAHRCKLSHRRLGKVQRQLLLL